MAVFNGKKMVVTPTPAAVGPVVSDHQASLIGRTLLVKGEVLSDDEVVIEGKIEGKITVKNRVVVGKNGQVKADIEAREIIVRGRVNGNLMGHYRVEIVPEGVLNGNISAPKVVIADGAVFDGNIDMKVREGMGGGKPAAPLAPEQEKTPGKTAG
ncbi:MAG TPA: polymer-forming cytoskeletal protein [Candidatus Aminicenantes bacterium]|nr:polymer-forming cytoskeletal protein [Candidatus Aminicenantes bacterium]